MKKFLFGGLCFLGLSMLFFSLPVDAHSTKSETLEGKVSRVLVASQLYQKLQVVVTSGSFKEQTIIVENGKLPSTNLHQYRVGDRLVIGYSRNTTGKPVYHINDYVRRTPLLWLFMIFLVATILVGGWQGATSLLGMLFSFLIIVFYILPSLSLGNNPLQAAVVGTLVITPVSFFLSHGLKKKTLVALCGTFIALAITGFLAGVFVWLTRLSGFSSEEAGFLQVYQPGLINMQGLLLAGILIGLLGVLDDITVSQAAIVAQLKVADPKLSSAELYRQAMIVGKDHIASMVNTLILVYVGAALPLLLLFVNNPHPLSEILNYEIVAEEVVRTLVGSIGLMLAVPITTYFAVLMVDVR